VAREVEAEYQVAALLAQEGMQKSQVKASLSVAKAGTPVRPTAAEKGEGMVLRCLEYPIINFRMAVGCGNLAAEGMALALRLMATRTSQHLAGVIRDHQLDKIRGTWHPFAGNCMDLDISDRCYNWKNPPLRGSREAESSSFLVT
jgi:hypothetical protein